MNVLDAIRNRREITKFLDEEIPADTLEKILEAAYMSPSGNNLPSREFLLTVQREKLDQLSHATPFVPWLKEATAAIVVTGRPDVSKYWLQDASIACGYIWLSAVEQGLGAAFGAIYHAEDPAESTKRETLVREVTGIPEDRKIVAIIGMGYPKGEVKPKKLLSREEIVYYENF
ncbi:nitroreductase family protein [Thalassobacillus pellis]|uniref:nitroreductase family protein n=1 Tax=Thalassobacillus pellis TaxID=748008 RepID=UPI00195F915A|nr:nitroreductase family protein [Thalassobacillus pellis]MBM7554246.1 nitroreductase [Thalassobacillus pellis]